MINDRIIKQIEHAQLFTGIKADDLKVMLECLGATTAHFGKNEYISLMDEEIRNIGIVLTGQVKMLKEDVWGNSSCLASACEGDLFGETFTCGTSSVAVVSFKASQDTDVLMLPFERVMHSCNMTCRFHHRLIENIVALIADKNLRLMNKMDVVIKKTLREKIMAYLSNEAEAQQSKYFTVPMGRVELADYLLASRSALTRELNNMRDDGMIDFDKNTFRIL